MGFNCGIVGLPNVGKSTLFNALTAAGAAAENYPFCTIDPNIGIVPVYDERLATIARVYKSAKSTPTTLEFVDIAGLVKGASKGEGLGNQFLAHIRDVHAICHVVRCFEDENVVHVDGSVNPRRDIEIVQTELLLRDLDTIEKKISETDKKAKSADKKIRAESDYYHRLRDHISKGQPSSREHPQTPDEEILLRDLHLLTNKPVMYIANVGENQITTPDDHLNAVKEIAAREGGHLVVACAEIEAEIASMNREERIPFLHDLGIAESGLDQVIREGYALLELLTFFTANENEARAWTLRRGLAAPKAAGEVHTDFEHGFIRAEVVRFADLSRLGSEHAIRDKGLLHLEGKEYVVQDGDILFFRASP